MWTALPNGFTKPDARGNQKLKLSVFLSPRLETTAPMGTLGEFPDFEHPSDAGVNWAATVNGLSFKVETSTAETPATRAIYDAAVTSADAEPALWDSFFGPSMPIKQFRFHDFSGATMRTFGTTSVFSTLKQQYLGVAATPALAFRAPTIAKLVQLPGVTKPPLLSILPTPILQTNPIVALATTPAVTPTITRNAAYTAFEAFHRPYVVPDTFKAPAVPEMDFHRAVSALGSYPALMRRLGFIVDIEVPFTAAMARASRIRILPVWPGARASKVSYAAADGQQVTHRDASPWTAYVLGRTLTLPQRVTKFMTASRDQQVRDGYLVARSITNPSSDPVKLYNVDIDLAASRLVNTAVNAAEIVNQQVVAQVGASAVKKGQVTASQVTSAAETESMTLPALGQPVIRMAVGGLADRVKAQMTRASQMNARLIAEQEEQTINYSEDVTRGYRIDVWDSVTRRWHRLCGRVGTYAIGTTPISWSGKATITDEGWVQLGGVSKPEDVNTETPPGEMRIHESVFDWGGWSLAVERPGNALSEPDADGVSTPTKTFQDPDGATRPLGSYLHPNLPLDVRFKVPAGDLPRLRFGTTYRFRARAVDLAGNSVAFSAGSVTADPGGSGDSNPLVTRAITHKRFDPVKPPIVVPVEDAKPAESPYVVVVRSYHDPKTGQVVTQNAARHIMPPRVAVSMAEACGGLDQSSTGRPMNKALWSVLKARDASEPPQNPDGSAKPQATVASPVEYLPDRFARGAAFKGLPGVASTVTSRTIATSARVSGVRIPLTSTSTETVSSFRVSFEKSDAPWYDRLPFRFEVHGVEGTDARLPLKAVPKLPAWGEEVRRLKVELPKADEVKVGLSSYFSSGDLQVMGVHQWTMEKFSPKLAVATTPVLRAVSASALPAVAPALNQVPVSTASTLPIAANALITTARIGQNWLLSPAQEITLVHAVDLPMIAPAFTSRAHMERRAGETHATLVDWMQVHGKSTVKLDVEANWTEPVDDPAKGAPLWGTTAVKKAAAAFSLPVDKKQTTILDAKQAVPGSMKPVAWGSIPADGMLVNKGGVDTKPQRQHFGDTKHKRVRYKATFTSRFDKHFADIEGLTYSVTSTERLLRVPNAARPAAPALEYIMPTFGWERSGSSSIRRGGGLRVYLERPWFSSGEGEQLAVVMYQPAAADAGYTQLKPFVTQWGRDPLWTQPGGLPSARPARTHFKQASRYGLDLKLREYSGAEVMVAGYNVDYDPELGLWFADIVVDQGGAYFPFIKLALARYQPDSLPTYELSSVVVADFVQLTPDRAASLSATVDARGGYSVRATVNGHSYSESDAGRKASCTMQLEELQSGKDATLGWTPLGSEVDMPIQPRTLAQIIVQDTRTTWAGTARLAQKVAGRSYRVVLREYEYYKQHQSQTAAKRLVYVETLPIS